MAQVIIDIDFNTKEANKNLSDLNNAVRAQRELLKNLENQAKNTTDGYEVYGEQIAEAQVQLKILQGEQRSQARLLELEQKAIRANSGSYQELVATQALAEAQLKALEGTLKRNADGTIELTDEYKKQAEAVEQAKEAIIEFNEGIANGTSSVGLYGRALKNFTAEQKQTIENTEFFGVSINKLRTGFTALQGGLGALGKSFKTLNGIIATGGFGLLVALLGSVVSFLTKTQAGIDLVEQATAAFNTTVQFLFDQVSKVGEALINAFTNPKKALTDLVNFVKQQVIDQFNGVAKILQGIVTLDFDKIKEGFDLTTIGKATKAVQEFGKEVSKVVGESVRLARIFQDNEDAQRELNIEIAKQQKTIIELEKSAKNVALSEQERIANLQKANAIIEKQGEEQLRLARERFEVIKAQNALAESFDADLDKQAEAEKEVANLEAQLVAQREQNENKIENLRRAAEADRLKAIEERTKKIKEANAIRLSDELARINTELLAVEEGSAKELELKLKLIDQETKIALSAENLTQAQRELIVATGLKKIRDLEKQFSEAKKEEAKTEAEARIQLEDNRVQRKITSLQKELEADTTTFERRNELANQLLELEQDRLNNQEQQLLSNELLSETQRLIIKEEFAQKRIDLETSTLTKLDELDAQSANAETQRLLNEQKLREELARQEIELEQTVASSVVSIGKDLLQTFGEQSEEAKALLKAISIAEIGINLQKELSAIAVNAAANPANAITAGGAGAAQNATLSAIAIAKSALAVAKVLAFEDGGLVSGPSHAQGGVPFTVKGSNQPMEMEGGEFIMSKPATALFGGLFPILNAIGNRSKKIGSPTFFQDGGMVARNFAVTTNSARQTTNEVVEAIKNLKVFTNIVDLNQVETDTNQVRALASA